MDAFSGDSAETASDNASGNDIPDYSSRPVITLADDFIVGETYKFMCPHCGKQEFGINSNKAGHKEFTCPKCNGRIAANVREKTKVFIPDETCALIKGKLILLRRNWLNKSYSLGAGSHIIGRYDESAMSDIAIRNDNSISRRSLRIDVTQTARGYTFKLTVLRSTNPVLHNGVRLSDGESVSLNFGDTIVLGRTKLRFEKDLK